MKDIRDEIAGKFIAALNGGIIPWRKPWKDSGMRPRNAFTQRPYRGANAFLLSLVAMFEGYKTGEWLTLNQCHKNGGRVKDDQFSKGHNVIFWKFIKKEDSQGKVTTFPLCRSFRVWNRDQCEGLPEVVREVTEFSPIVAAQAILDGMKNAPVMNIIQSDAAFYRPSTDTITLPLRESFISPSHFYATAFHEMGHATGHKNRLNRDGVMESKGFGSESYSREELIAEMTSAFLCAEAGIFENVGDNSTAYIQGWAEKLGKEPRLIIEAAGAAQKAADLILGTTFTTEEE